jgi:hypothetical protein
MTGMHSGSTAAWTATLFTSRFVDDDASIHLVADDKTQPISTARLPRL